MPATSREAAIVDDESHGTLYLDLGDQNMDYLLSMSFALLRSIRRGMATAVRGFQFNENYDRALLYMAQREAQEEAVDPRVECLDKRLQ